MSVAFVDTTWAGRAVSIEHTVLAPQHQAAPLLVELLQPAHCGHAPQRNQAEALMLAAQANIQKHTHGDTA